MQCVCKGTYIYIYRIYVLYRGEKELYAVYLLRNLSQVEPQTTEGAPEKTNQLACH